MRYILPVLVGALVAYGLLLYRNKTSATSGELALRDVEHTNVEIDEDELYEGVTAEITFPAPGPTFHDLLALCKLASPEDLPATGSAFSAHTGLGFDQIDDFYGVRSESGGGDDEIVFLAPIIDGKEVWHHDGPFEALRLRFNVLRTSPRHAAHFLKCVTDLSTLTSDPAPDLVVLEGKINAIAAYWTKSGIKPGSDKALLVDY